ncbi:hypothetical protein BN1095_6840002 [Clostridioides difficile]|uniref:Uncharacterized protein n=1 Tax=Clostridioides difficile TaxID=1496 RepID=A0A069AYQ1_CLODI|nr:hypothetical protein BN1095_6840002 [Clostridioides difficile]
MERGELVFRNQRSVSIPVQLAAGRVKLESRHVCGAFTARTVAFGFGNASVGIRADGRYRRRLGCGSRRFGLQCLRQRL